MKVWWLTIAYGAVTMGSVGLVGFGTEFLFGTRLWELKDSGEKAMGLFDAQQVWLGSWLFIIVGTLMQMVAVWIWN